MADDKIVTKKTAVKKSAPRKAATKKAPVSHSAASATSAPNNTAAPRDTARTATAKKAPAAKKAATAATPKKETTRAAAPAKSTPSPPPREHRPQDNQGSLKQLATITAEQRLDMIKEAAFYKAEKRSFVPGHEQEDWADAEREIDELLARAKAMTGGKPHPA